MKYAASMRYAGMLVDAAEADYSSYKNLGLLCPICHAPVFLVSGSDRAPTTRKITDKTTGIVKEVPVAAATVEAHFSHFKDVSEEQVKQCELRVRGIKPAEIHRCIAIARHQRERFFKSHFWQLLELGYKMETWEEDVVFAHSGFIASCPAKDPDNCRELKWAQLVNEVTSRFALKRDYLVSVAERCLNDIVSKDVGLLRQVGFKPETIAYLEQWKQGIDGRMQLEIVREAIDFLCHKRNRELVQLLFAKGLADYALNGSDAPPTDELLKPCVLNSERMAAQMAQYSENFKAIHTWNPQKLRFAIRWIFEDIAVILATTPWADGFEKLEEQQSPERTQLNPYSKGIWHYTVNTGNTSFQPFSKLSESSFDSLKDEIASLSGGGVLIKSLPAPYSVYSLKITIDPNCPGAAFFDIGKGKQPGDSLMLTAAVAWTKTGEGFLMAVLPAMYDFLSQAIAPLGFPVNPMSKPQKLPWLAIFLMPNPEIGLCRWLANAEYAIAKLLIDSAKN